MSSDESIPPPLSLHATFSTYGHSATTDVEEWLQRGGIQPSEETIKSGFPFLYDQVYFSDIHGKTYWGRDYGFTEVQRNRWTIMESIAGLEPVMDSYQRVCEQRRAAAEISKAKFKKQ